MSHTPHELAQDFPDKVAQIAELKSTDNHFARLADEYHQINRAVHRAETLVEPMSETAEAELRRKRAALKDEIWSILARQTAS